MKVSNSINNINFLDQAKKSSDTALNRIAAARDISAKDSANMLISDSLRVQLGTISEGVQNSNYAVSMLQIADSSIQNLRESADKLNELSVRNNNASLNSDQRSMLANEFESIRNAMADIVDNTTYNGKSLFDQNFTFSTGEGKIDVNLSDVNLEELSIDNQDSIKSLIDNLDMVGSNIGSATNALNVTISNQLAAISNLSFANSQIEESDIYKDFLDYNQSNIQLEASTIAQSHKMTTLQQQMQTLLG